MGEENTTVTEYKIDTTTMKMPGQKVQHSHLGPILGVLLIILVLVAVGLYLWGAELIRNKPVQDDSARIIENNEPETPRADADIQIFETLSSSNEIDAIDADIQSTNLDSLDSDLNALDKEFTDSLQVQ